MDSEAKIEESGGHKIPELRERRTEMPDGRYLIYYDFENQDRPAPPSDIGERPVNV